MSTCNGVEAPEARQAVSAERIGRLRSLPGSQQRDGDHPGKVPLVKRCVDKYHLEGYA
jgi:hypothetical protein